MVSGGQDTVRVGCGRGKAWLWRDVGMSGGAVVTLGMRWRSRVTREREEQWPEVGGPGCFSSFLLNLKAGVRAGAVGDRQRRGRGCRRVPLRG
jgi:hypothetical protein